jgi:hypothetical protein
LRTPISLRAKENSWTEGQIAKRDLGRYYQLLGEALAGLHLTRFEGQRLARILWNEDLKEMATGDPFIPEHRNPSEYLLGLVRQSVENVQRRGKVPSLREYALLDKIERMSSMERAAIVDAIDRLPGDSEETFGNPGDWQLIGVHLVEQPLTVEAVVSEK